LGIKFEFFVFSKHLCLNDLLVSKNDQFSFLAGRNGEVRGGGQNYYSDPMLRHAALLLLQLLQLHHSAVATTPPPKVLSCSVTIVKLRIVHLSEIKIPESVPLSPCST
jgi:hypothetical protein